MFIQVEKTPNPETLKFIPGVPVLASGTREFRNLAEAAASPLAQHLFRQDGVRSVFFGADFISVSKEVSKDWSVLKTLVLAAIMEHFSTGQQVLNDHAEEAKAPHQGSDLDNAVVTQICELIETRVRPAVQMDGGDIVFDKFEDGVVYLHMRGACSGCPSSTMTLKSGIENMLKHFVPEVVEVRAADSL